MRKVDSNQVWTSYAGLEVRLIVQDFYPRFSDSTHPFYKPPTNLFRDDEFKTVMQYYRFC